MEIDREIEELRTDIRMLDFLTYSAEQARFGNQLRHGDKETMEVLRAEKRELIARRREVEKRLEVEKL